MGSEEDLEVTVFPEVPGLAVDDAVAWFPEPVFLAAEVEIEEYVFLDSVGIIGVWHGEHDFLVAVGEVEAEGYAL